MRSILSLALVFMLAGVPALPAQQVAPPVSAEQSAAPLGELPMPRLQVETTPAAAPTFQSEAVRTASTAELSATSALAIIGGLVVLIALFALLR